VHQIIVVVTNWVTSTIDATGYWGVVTMMGIESACIPLPSEIIMPYGGFMVHKNPEQLSLWWMGVAGAGGCVWGSIVAYYVGMFGGRPLVERYGKYVLVRTRDLDRADAWFAKYGDAAIFFSRLMPVVRTFISFPAGVAKMHFWRFVIYTFVGSLPWCLGLAYVGKVLGQNWNTIGKYFHGADVIIVAGFLALVGLYVYHHIKSERDYQAEKAAAGE